MTLRTPFIFLAVAARLRERAFKSVRRAPSAADR
jgi:hypothetical protein